MTHHLAYIAAAVAAGLLGGIVSAYWSPNRKLTSYIQHFAAGIVIAAVSLKVAPDTVKADAPPLLLLGGFAFGGLVMIGVKWATMWIEKQQSSRKRKPWGLTIAAAVDTAIDGAIIGAGFAVEERLGEILALALGLELLVLTLSVGASFRENKASRVITFAVTAGISLLLLVGALLGMVLLKGASTAVLAVVLSIGAAALLYLVTEELLIETRLPEETLMSTAMFFLGFLVIFALVLVGEPANS